MAEIEDPTKSKEEGGKLEEEFDEICYLAVQSDFFSNWYRNVNPNKRTDRFPAVYMATDLTNSTSINSSITATLMNKIALQDFVYAKPALFSLLYPKLELYRIDYEAGKQEATERLFLIPHEANELYNSFDNVNTKVAGAGIKNLNWTLAGSNPAAAEKLIDLELNLEFANSYELSPNTLDEILINYIGGKGFPFNETDTDNTTINFLSLILHPQGKRNEYNGKFYRIKAKLGWQRVDSEILQQIGYEATVAEALSAALSTQSMTLILNLISHSFELTEEGSISLQAKYQASLEQATDADIFDLFYRHSLKKQRLDSPGSTLDQLRQEKEALQTAINDNCINLSNDEKTALKELILVEKDKEIQEAIEQQEDTLKQLEIEAKQSLTRHLSANESITTGADWVAGVVVGGAVIGAVGAGAGAAGIVGASTSITGVGGAGVGAIAGATTVGATGGSSGVKNSLTIYSVTVSDKDVENYINYIKEINSGNKNSVLAEPSLKSNAVQVGVNRDDAADIAQQATEVNAQSTSTTDTVIAKAETALQGVVEGIAKFGEFLYDFGSNDRIISFIYLYDLLTTFYNVLVEHINTEYQQDGNKRSELLTELKRFKVVLGDYQDRDTGNVVNIGEIPIHLQTFNEWYTNNIAKPNRVNYTFRDFVYSMVNDIVAKSLGASCVTGADLEKKISLGFSTYSLQHNVGNEPCELSELNTSNTPTGYINFGVKQIKDSYTNSIIPTSNNVKGIENTNYLYVYAKQLPCELKGNIFEDIDKGIYHFFIGQTEGIQKSIKFKRIDQPYLKEARATKEDSFVLGQLREVYNADIVMVGNTIFHPGMIIYIHPPIEMGVTSNENTFSYLLGIGGYYSVIKVQSSLSLEGFETTLECVYLTSPNCKEPCTDVANKTPEQQLQSNLSNLKVLKVLNSSVLKTNDAIKQAAESGDRYQANQLSQDLDKKIEVYNKLVHTDDFKNIGLAKAIFIENVEVETFDSDVPIKIRQLTTTEQTQNSLGLLQDREKTIQQVIQKKQQELETVRLGIN